MKIGFKLGPTERRKAVLAAIDGEKKERSNKESSVLLLKFFSSNSQISGRSSLRNLGSTFPSSLSLLIKLLYSEKFKRTLFFWPISPAPQTRTLLTASELKNVSVQHFFPCPSL